MLKVNIHLHLKCKKLLSIQYLTHVGKSWSILTVNRSSFLRESLPHHFLCQVMRSDGVHGCESASEILTLLGSDGGHCCESASVKPQQEQQQRGTANGDAHGEEKVSGDAHGEEKVNVDGNDEEKVSGGGHSDHDDHSHGHSHDLGNGNEASVRHNGSIQSCG